MSAEAINQEPIGEIVGLMLCQDIINFYSIIPYTQERIKVGTKVYISPQRKWQGLTDDELHALHYELKCAAMGATSTLGMYRILEAKLKEKNT